MKIRLALLPAVLVFLGGCLSVSDTQEVTVDRAGIAETSGKTVAIMPANLKSGTVAIDTIVPVRNEVNKQIPAALAKKLSGARFKNPGEVGSALSGNNELDLLTELHETYAMTGVIDREKTRRLARRLDVTFLMLSQVVGSKASYGIGYAQGYSLESMLVNASTGEVVWSGIGEWKKGGAFFTVGEGKPAPIAGALIKLALQSL